MKTRRISKCLISGLFLLNSVPSLGQVVRALSASIPEYKSYLARNQSESYIDFFERSRQQANSIYEIADAEDFTRLLDRVPLNDVTREMWISIYLKNAPTSDKIDSLLLLDPGLELVFKKKAARSNSENLKQKIQQWKNSQSEDALLYIDGLALDKASFVTDSEHQFVFVSNASVPIIYYGKWQGFLKIPPVAFASGECRSPEIKGENWNQAYFSDECIYSKNLTEVAQHVENSPETKASWLVPLTIGLSAALVYGLKDKRVTLKAPAFKF
jgi:hypothetical protein